MMPITTEVAIWLKEECFYLQFDDGLIVPTQNPFNFLMTFDYSDLLFDSAVQDGVPVSHNNPLKLLQG